MWFNYKPDKHGYYWIWREDEGYCDVAFYEGGSFVTTSGEELGASEIAHWQGPLTIPNPPHIPPELVRIELDFPIQDSFHIEIPFNAIIHHATVSRDKFHFEVYGDTNAPAEWRYFELRPYLKGQSESGISKRVISYVWCKGTSMELWEVLG